MLSAGKKEVFEIKKIDGKIMALQCIFYSKIICSVFSIAGMWQMISGIIVSFNDEIFFH